MRSAMKPEATRLTMPKPEHERQHLGSARDAVAEVAAIGDDVNLRHRHRDAAGDARHDQQTCSTPGERPRSAERLRLAGQTYGEGC